MINTNLQSEIELTNTGDNVSIKYVDAIQTCVPAIYFKNNTLNLKVSENQKSVIKQMNDNKDNVNKKKDVDDIKDKIKNMSDEDLIKNFKK